MPLRDDEIRQVHDIVDNKIKSAMEKYGDPVADDSHAKELEKWRANNAKSQKMLEEWKTQFEKDKALYDRLEKILPSLEKFVSEQEPDTPKKTGGKKK